MIPFLVPFYWPQLTQPPWYAPFVAPAVTFLGVLLTLWISGTRERKYRNADLENDRHRRAEELVREAG